MSSESRSDLFERCPEREQRCPRAYRFRDCPSVSPKTRRTPPTVYTREPPLRRLPFVPAPIRRGSSHRLSVESPRRGSQESEKAELQTSLIRRSTTLPNQAAI